ncbi:MAG: hypothetical protein AAFQ74_07405 [Cyanobacteria bacterium J06623_4]
MSAKRPSKPAQIAWCLPALLPALIVVAGVGLSLWIQTSVESGVWLGRGSGINALVTQHIAQQIRAGRFPLDVALNLPAADWVIALWQEGLYPFQANFAPDVAAQPAARFPFVFPTVSASLYVLFERLLGGLFGGALSDRTLYIIPLLALWATWLRFWQVGWCAGWGLIPLCLGLVGLIFGSSFSIYGSVLGPQTLAVALAFWGLSILIFPESHHSGSFLHTPRTRGAISRGQVLRSGILLGLSAWFGSEFVCLALAIGLLAILGWRFPKWQIFPRMTLAKVCILLGAIACTIGILLALNYAIYADPIILRPNVTAQRSGALWLAISLLQYFPLAWVIGLTAILMPELKRPQVKVSPFKRKKPKASKGNYFSQLGIYQASAIDPMPSRFSLLVTLLFLVLVSFVVPPAEGSLRWGQERYLVLIPLLSVLLAEQLRAGRLRRWARPAILVGAVITLVFGMQLNTVSAVFGRAERSDNPGSTAAVLDRSKATSMAIEAFGQEPVPWVALSHGSAAEQLWTALPGKTFFRAESAAEVKKLADRLVDLDEREFLYVCSPFQTCQVPNTPGSDLSLEDGTHRLNMTFLGNYGQYSTYKVEIVP